MTTLHSISIETIAMTHKCGFYCSKPSNGTYFRVKHISQLFLQGRNWLDIKVNDIVLSINGTTFENWVNLTMINFIHWNYEP
jgi:hypothetical protein